ncbi:MAG: discoidin domain-containing protein [Pseudomonadota bacterium]
MSKYTLPVKSTFMLLASLIAVIVYGCDDSDKGGLTHAPSKDSATSNEKIPDGKSAHDGTNAFVLTASSQSTFGPQGLFSAISPGWHSQQPPQYPESITADLGVSKQIGYIGILQQEGHPTRAPKAFRVEMSDDGITWLAVAGSDNACTQNMPDGWFNVDLPKPSFGRYLRVIVFSNCGDAQMLTLRGLRVG